MKLNNILAIILLISLSGFNTTASSSSNYSPTIQQLHKGCDSGIAISCYVLSLAYKKGNGVKQSYSKAAQLSRIACESGLCS